MEENKEKPRTVSISGKEPSPEHEHERALSHEIDKFRVTVMRSLGRRPVEREGDFEQSLLWLVEALRAWWEEQKQYYETHYREP